MSESVDVRAVMARDAGDAHKHRCGQLKPGAVIRREQMSVDAHAAVAELIEADKEYDAAAEAYRAAVHSGTSHAEFVEIRDRMRDATLRRAAALARVQGGAK